MFCSPLFCKRIAVPRWPYIGVNPPSGADEGSKPTLGAQLLPTTSWLRARGPLRVYLLARRPWQNVR